MVDALQAAQIDGRHLAGSATEGDNPVAATRSYGRYLEARLEEQPSLNGQMQILGSVVPTGTAKQLDPILLTTGAVPKTVLERLRKPIPPEHPRRREYVVAAQEWEGVVEDVRVGSFVALLRDLVTGARERTEIDFDEVSEFDLHLISSGAVFYWTIGYQVRSSGQRTGLSTIMFRRLPVWTESELDEARKEADATFELFGWSEDPRSPSRES